MENIYCSDYIKIYKDQDILIQKWTKIPLTTQHFQKELLNFLEVFKKERPSSILWLQENFDLEIPDNIYEWIQKHILEPQYKAGLRNLAFTVPKEQYAHLSIINSFNEVSSVLEPKYFLTKEKALEFLKAEEAKKEFFSEITYVFDRSKNNTRIYLEVDHKQLPHTIKHLNRLNHQLKFRAEHQCYFDKLTLRELEIFKSISFGMTNKEIASALNISEYTIATHRKSLIKKLEIKSPNDWQFYANAFL
ncbi:helix-turn-helix transcriptional regulator [Mesonia sp.]|uniref:helix-turn-helix transcriptional regulator n=1 Tax=Mesonia sp. TaxID=1960830 RepID=UPI0017700EB6|nr:helix-turn-helix transcriptional regulator [Mesonia sp.]HIB37262.1 LuxR family transcriptional regulator [Mesonia sp.]HIO26976.1 LuxR family transcriptional regulator [Flavobacteriaceae bacterium]